ncbi:MAG: hypothetical protein AMS15_06910 [Planctomycetes bacterium DG_23]|nr:MAG: hypothetical protein AMS15_06910 [Planctomycetes bacterium DG_23]
MKGKVWFSCASVILSVALAAALAQEEGVILRYKYKPGQEVIYGFTEMQFFEMRKGEEISTHEVKIEGKFRDFALSVSEEGVIETAFCQDEKVVMHKMDGKSSPVSGEVMADLFWQKFNSRGQPVVEKEGRFGDYFEQTEIIELPEGPINVGSTWKTGPEEDYVTYEVLAKEPVGQDQCFKIKSVRHMTLGEGLPSPQLEIFLWFAVHKGCIVKFSGTATTTGTFTMSGQEISIQQKSIFMGAIIEEKSFDEAEISSRRKQLEKLYAIQDAIDDQEFDQAASDLKAFSAQFPDSPYAEVAATQRSGLEEARQMAARPQSLVGQPAPAFELLDFEGNTVSLADFQGKVVFLDFWATWCGPCVYAVPCVQALYEKYKDKGVVVIGMNVSDDPEAAKKFAEEKGLTYTHLFADEISDVYPVSGIPTFFIIDQEAIVRYQRSGFLPGLEKEWGKEIETLLSAPGGE